MVWSDVLRVARGTTQRLRRRFDHGTTPPTLATPAACPPKTPMRPRPRPARFPARPARARRGQSRLSPKKHFSRAGCD